ncbi:Katanin p80 WD40-containing subunit B1, partial [Aphelenchoides avenae]
DQKISPAELSAGVISSARGAAIVGSPLTQLPYKATASSMRLPSFDNPVQCMQLNRPESFLGVGSNSLSILNLEKGIVWRTINEQDGAITGIAWNPLDPFLLATVGSDCTLRTWDIRSHPALISTRRSQRRFRCLQYSPDSVFIAAAGDGVCVYDLRAPQPVFQTSCTSTALDICFNPAECVLATSNSDRLARLYDVDTGECISQSLPFDSAASRISFHPSGSYLLAASSQRLYGVLWEPYSVIAQVPLPQPSAASSRSAASVPATTLDLRIDSGRIFHLASDGDSVRLSSILISEFEKGPDHIAVAQNDAVVTSSPFRSNVELARGDSPGLIPLPIPRNESPDYTSSEPVSPETTRPSISEQVNEFETDDGELSSMSLLSDAMNSAFSVRPLASASAQGPASRALRHGNSFTAAHRSVSTTSLNSTDGKTEPTKSKRTNTRAVSGTRAGHADRKPPVQRGVAFGTSLPPRPAPSGNAPTRFTQSDKPNRSNGRRSSVADTTASSSRSDGSRPETPSDDMSQMTDKVRGRQRVDNLMKKRKADLKRMIMTAKTAREKDEAVEESTRLDEHHLFARVLTAYKTKPSAMSLMSCSTILPHFRGILSDRNAHYVDLGLDMLNLIVDTFGESIRHGLAANSASALGVDVAAEDRFKRCTRCRSALMELQINAPFLLGRMSKSQQMRFNALMPSIESIVDE